MTGPGRITVAVLPVQPAVPVGKLKDIGAPPGEAMAPEAEQEAVSNELARVADEIGQEITDALAKGNGFIPTSPGQVTTMLGPFQLEGPLAEAQAQTLARELGAQTILVTTLSGYGKIKRKWLYFLIGSGVVEGVVQGVVVTVAVNNEWIGLAVAAEEILQETLTWGGGVYLFDRIFTPVILEGELRSGADGKVLWTDTSFARINRKALKDYPEADRGKKEVRLRVTAQRAVDEMVKDLEKTAKRQAKRER